MCQSKKKKKKEESEHLNSKVSTSILSAAGRLSSYWWCKWFLTTLTYQALPLQQYQAAMKLKKESLWQLWKNQTAIYLSTSGQA